jgi:hypothetical protein
MAGKNKERAHLSISALRETNIEPQLLRNQCQHTAISWRKAVSPKVRKSPIQVDKAIWGIKELRLFYRYYTDLVQNPVGGEDRAAAVGRGAQHLSSPVSGWDYGSVAEVGPGEKGRKP